MVLKLRSHDSGEVSFIDNANIESVCIENDRLEVITISGGIYICDYMLPADEEVIELWVKGNVYTIKHFPNGISVSLKVWIFPGKYAISRHSKVTENRAKL